MNRNKPFRFGISALKWFAYVLCLLLLWQLYVSAARIPRFILPPPTEVLKELDVLLKTGELYAHFLYTARNMVCGFGIGLILGALLGTLCSKSAFVSSALSPFLVFLQAMPKIALAPLFVLWFGLGLKSQLILIVSLAFFPVLSGTVAGLRSRNPDFDHLRRIFVMGKSEFFYKVEIPAAVPLFFAGVRLALLDALTGAVLAEFIASEKGLGYLLVLGNSTYKTSVLLAAVAAILCFGVLVYLLIQCAENYFLRWRDNGRNETVF